jgi:hypothetical protein
VARCRCEIDDRVQAARTQHRLQVVEDGDVRRPAIDGGRRTLRGIAAGVHQRHDADGRRQLGQRREVVSAGDVAAADDADPQRVRCHLVMVRTR